MNNMDKQIKKAMKDLKQEVSRVAHEQTAKAAAPILTSLEREVGRVFDDRQDKTEAQIRDEVRIASATVDVELDDSELNEIVTHILTGERPTFVAEIRITGLD